jgi:hypothetical protein
MVRRWERLSRSAKLRLPGGCDVSRATHYAPFSFATGMEYAAKR